MWFGCWHKWFGLSGKTANLVVTNGIDIKFEIIPQVCLRCKEVRWKYVGGNL